MRLNTLSPAEGSRKVGKRVGRGIGSGLGKTGGRGHKGQKSRSVAVKLSRVSKAVSMPLQRRLPKFGFTSRLARVLLRKSVWPNWAKVEGDVIDLEALKAANVMKRATLSVLASSCLAKSE